MDNYLGQTRVTLLTIDIFVFHMINALRSVRKGFYIVSYIILMSGQYAVGQSLENIGLATSDGLRVQRFILSDTTWFLPENQVPVFSFVLNGRYHQSDDVSATLSGTRFLLTYEESLKVTFTSFGGDNIRKQWIRYS